GGGSLDAFGLVIAINRLIEQGRLAIEAYSTMTVSLRYLAAAMGIPYIPTKSLLGSDVLARLEASAPDSVRVSTCPFTGERLLLLRALQPDVAVVQVQQADVEGNARIYGPTWDNDEALKAAKRVILLAEEIVSTDHLREYVAAAKDPPALERYLDRYVYSVEDHFAYLERVGGVARLSQLKADPLLGY